MNHQRQDNGAQSQSVSFSESGSATLHKHKHTAHSNGGHCSAAMLNTERKNERKVVGSQSVKQSQYLSLGAPTLPSAALPSLNHNRNESEQVNFPSIVRTTTAAANKQTNTGHSSSLGFVIAGKSLFSKSISISSSRITGAEKHLLNIGPTKQCTLQIFN